MLEKSAEEIQWFKNAGLGLFIHWGLYSASEGRWRGKETPGIGEWIAAKEEIPNDEYEKLADKMTLEEFDADSWAELAKRAGMRYMVFTAKHHEGFAMYDTSYDDYSIVKRSPYGKDVAAELTTAMRKKGIVPCFYYSQAIDFHEENAMGNTWYYKKEEKDRAFKKYINGKCKYQLKELLENYGDIGIIWMDVPKGMTEEIAADLKSYVKSIQPKCLISGRIGGTEDMGDYGCLGDNQIPAGKLSGCWETASTMNGTWGYKTDDHNFKSTKEITELLCSVVSKGANLLLNIGPDAHGRIPEESVQILNDLADWISINGEAVHDTEESPFMSDFSFGTACTHDNILYLFLTEKRERISIRGLKNDVKNAEVLGYAVVPYTNDNGLEIDLAGVKFSESVTVVKITLDTKPDIESGMYQQETDRVVLPASLCSVVKGSNSKDEVSVSEGDAAVAAEKFNLKTDDKISVTQAGVVEKWFSDKDFIEWEVRIGEVGRYDALLYTLTEKYMPWQGGHRVRLVCENTELRAVLTEDEIPTGANRRYFSETGSRLGEISIDKAGVYKIRLYLDQLNSNDTAGLSVSRMIFKKVSI